MQHLSTFTIVIVTATAIVIVIVIIIKITLVILIKIMIVKKHSKGDAKNKETKQHVLCPYSDEAL